MAQPQQPNTATPTGLSFGRLQRRRSLFSGFAAKKGTTRSDKSGGARPLQDDDDEDSATRGAEAVPVASMSPLEKMHKIIDLQQFDGSWQLSDLLLEITGVKREQLSSERGDMNEATALAIAWLKFQVANQEDVWEMVVDKATGGLETRLGAGDRAEAMVNRLAALLTRA
jgi:hypothetical protein